jgi:hypothetical protein
MDGRSGAGLLTLTIRTSLAIAHHPGADRWRLRRSHGPFGMMGFDLLLLGEVLVVVGGEEGAYAAGAGGEDLLDEGRRVAGRLAWR